MKRCDLRRGPNQRPQALRDRNSDAISPLESMRDQVQRELDIVELAGLQGGWLFHRIATRQVEHVVGHQPGFSLRRYFGYAYRNLGDRNIGADANLRDRKS